MTFIMSLKRGEFIFRLLYRHQCVFYLIDNFDRDCIIII